MKKIIRVLQTCSTSSGEAYAWAEKHPGAYYNQNLLNQKYQPAIATGEYGDTHADDEFFWAASDSISQPEKRYTGKKQ